MTKRRHIRMARAAWRSLLIRLVVKGVVAIRSGTTYTKSAAETAVVRAYRAANGRKA